MAAGFEDFAHHDALADSEACAAIILHAAKRHEASSIEELAQLTSVRIGVVGAPEIRAAEEAPMAL
jgi:DNA polymerase-3 subunit epsilon